MGQTASLFNVEMGLRAVAYAAERQTASLFNVEMGLRAVAYAAERQTAHRHQIADGITRDVFLCVVDHFEPHVGQPSPHLARARMDDWLHRYPQIAGRHRDADGRPPAHSFFYPYDEYDAWEFARLVELCDAGWGEIELHLHHHDDTSASLRRKLYDAVHLFQSQGALSVWPDNRPAWGFIHGNWALDNSRCENGKNFCGVNDELTLLAQQGCYADFTFPAWEHTAQPRQLNSIYYALDDPNRPKSYDRGKAVRSGGQENGTLMLIQGPLMPHLKRTRGGLFKPAMDDGDMAFSRRYSPQRLDRWVRAGIGVAGCADRVFIKLHCHGAADKNRECLLGSDLDALFSDAEARYNDGKRFRLHYVTAREMFNVVKATEANLPAKIDFARDYLLPPPAQASAISKKAALAAKPSLWEFPIAS